MAATARRRGYGEDSVYFDAANNCWTAAVSLGYSPDGKRRIRRKVAGKSKTEVRDKLKALHRELEAGIRPRRPTRWLYASRIGSPRDCRAQRQHDRQLPVRSQHAVAKIGAVKLRDLTARHVQTALNELSRSLSTRSLRLVHQVMERSIRHAQAADLVGRNVASLVSAPDGAVGDRRGR